MKNMNNNSLVRSLFQKEKVKINIDANCPAKFMGFGIKKFMCRIQLEQQLPSSPVTNGVYCTGGKGTSRIK